MALKHDGNQTRRQSNMAAIKHGEAPDLSRHRISAAGQLLRCNDSTHGGGSQIASTMSPTAEKFLSRN